MTSRNKRFVALHTLENFSRMRELAIIQTSSLVKYFLASTNFEKVLSTAVGRHMVHKGSAVHLWTQVTRICHLKGTTQWKRVPHIYWWCYNQHSNIVLCPLSLSHLTGRKANKQCNPKNGISFPQGPSHHRWSKRTLGCHFNSYQLLSIKFSKSTSPHTTHLIVSGVEGAWDVIWICINY